MLNQLYVRPVIFQLIALVLPVYLSNAQTAKNVNNEIITVSDADTSYIKTFKRSNDVRLILGAQGSGLYYQSTRDQNFQLEPDAYKNVNELAGFGLTYKIIDFDLIFSLPGSELRHAESQNLKQFKFSIGYTMRKNSIRIYISDSRGIVATEPESNFESAPDISLFKVGAQITHIFNSEKYSYRAANFQSELQTQTAGSFLLRIEPFYRKFGLSTAITPEHRNVSSIFGNQAGLEYVNASGLVVMPGYGITVAKKDGRFYLAPMILGGPGVAFNTYKSSEGNFTTTNWEANATTMLNLGYNGHRIYVNLRTSYDLNFSFLDPSYFTTTEGKVYLTIGYRFSNLENFIPMSLL